jgi:acylphosphatase
VSAVGKRVRLRIEGRVQGVCYRANTLREATALGVNGTVRNLPDGSVEALLEGDEAAVDRLIYWCRQGPPGAEVSRVIVDPETYRGEFSGFQVTG